MILETPRLLLRQWEPTDFDAFAAMHAEPEVMEFLAADGKPTPRFIAWQSFCAILGHWQLRGYGLFAVIERHSGELAGRVGPWFPEGWPEFEVGWTLRSAFWGRGYASEAAQAAIDFSFTQLARPHIASFINPANTRSIRVAERLGESPECRVVLPHVPDREVIQYGMHRAVWLRRRQGA